MPDLQVLVPQFCHMSLQGLDQVSYTNERIVPLRQFSLTRQVPSASSGPSKHALIEKYFSKYKDAGEEAILAEGMEKFCVDLGVDPTEFVVLVLAWKFGASQMCRFTKEEFLNGCQKMRVHDAKALRRGFLNLWLRQERWKTFRSYTTLHSHSDWTTPRVKGLFQLRCHAALGLGVHSKQTIILDQWFAFLKEKRCTWDLPRHLEHVPTLCEHNFARFQ